ncbi:MAG: uroporphyrinogen-III synthase [Methanosarcinales archaeon]|jgi:uroporphyrinogen-III synthase|nr:uroporphyrinogen-III synthase [Methanosarcinales archaeon]MCK4812063.1 uroporphyrinogen-III synthase [Methanosarcinales archaeon]
MNRPVVAIMRPDMHLDSSIELARSRGFDVIAAPMIELESHCDDRFDGFVERVLAHESDIVVFTSANGIAFTLQKIRDVSGFISALNMMCVVAIGSKTKKALEKQGITVSMMPDSFSSEGIAEMLGETDGKIPQVIEVVRSAHGDPALIASLSGRVAVTVHETVVYRLVLPDDGRQQRLIEETLAGRIDAFAFTSAMTVHNFMKVARSMEGESGVVDMLNERIVAAIGPPTAGTLQQYGVKVQVVPERFIFKDMIDALETCV